jgi:hypothetical protein
VFCGIAQIELVHTDPSLPLSICIHFHDREHFLPLSEQGRQGVDASQRMCFFWHIPHAFKVLFMYGCRFRTRFCNVMGMVASSFEIYWSSPLSFLTKFHELTKFDYKDLNQYTIIDVTIDFKEDPLWIISAYAESSVGKGYRMVGVLRAEYLALNYGKLNQLQEEEFVD